ncbi:MAG: Phosphate acyltransferase [Pelotomaculum sp. PtaB.Bin013]|uniref:Phosphate acyltransferase n=1 Tax=Pelotomaculum isophthalicicum JI TaxID=947010 RepID=A0A9X4GZP0_9FIRM|nr:phosphate acyltransferase PlsX [Pelotomaculum isophthalicicum]MDF9408990.1 phosphate acyltransferase PlsX [Pelotomaculum isophthalicicum JI]OPX91785.1 MAG: Phosphate acyltransferase [Pelotomaculum sp. PtaB.Bin013]
MKIAVDAMGGDYAPREIVKGSLDAAKEYGISVILAGDEERVYYELGGDNAGGLVSVVNAPEVVEMCEQPAAVIRKKKNSSIATVTRLVKEGEAQALVSAGSTGAAMASALLGLGRIKGIDRPAIASLLPAEKGFTVLLDAGANVDCKPHHLVQFGIMGYLYAMKILGVKNPRVGLLSNGEEETKGNETILAAFPLLQKAGINFFGNVEGRDLFRDTVDVLVCDGFVGNVVLKTVEGMATSIFKVIREETTRNRLARMGVVLAGPALKGLQKRIDYAEYGGAPLLGVNGISVISHGSSTGKAIKNAIKVAGQLVENRLVESIRDSIENANIYGAGDRHALGVN